MRGFTIVCTGPLHRKMTQKFPCQGKHREFRHFTKTHKFPDSKGKRYFDICSEISILFRSLMSLPSHFGVCNSHKSCKLAQGKFAVGQGKHREFENAN